MGKLSEVAVGVCALTVAGCGGILGSDSTSSVPEPAGDPTPLAKCRVAASQSNPLVTEWPASEKAHLQSLADRQLVAVEYTGCELRIIPGCVLPGTYTWNRTTLATDTLEIRDADELYAKLPIGAIGLEGELARSGRLAVQTTVAGQLRAEAPSTPPATPACSQATHFVSAISVGAFKLISGAEASQGGGVGVAGVGAGARHEAGKSVLRTAGDPSKCSAEGTDTPNMDCASPIQLFLTPLTRGAVASGPAPIGQPPPSQLQDAISITFPAPDDEDERWSLRNADGAVVCQLPCTTMVPRISGYSLRREEPLAELDLPGKLDLTPGSSAEATYQAEQGSPVLSELNFYFVGLPTAAVSLGFGIWGASQLNGECTDHNGEPEDCFPGSGMLFFTSAMMAGIAGASYWWYAYSQEADLSFKTKSSASAPPARGIMGGPGGISGTF